MPCEVVSAWGQSRGQPPRLLSIRGPAGRSRTAEVLVPTPTPWTSTVLSFLKYCCAYGCFFFFNTASMQVSSCCPFAPAKVFPRPWQLPTRVVSWVVSLASSLTEAGVFEQLGFLLLPPGYSRSLLQQADVAVVTDSKFQHCETLFPAKMASRMGTGREYPSCCIVVACTAAHLGSEGYVFFFLCFVRSLLKLWKWRWNMSLLPDTQAALGGAVPLQKGGLFSRWYT